MEKDVTVLIAENIVIQIVIKQITNEKNVIFWNKIAESEEKGIDNKGAEC